MLAHFLFNDHKDQVLLLSGWHGIHSCVLTKTKQHIQIALLQRCVLMCIAWSEAFHSPGFPTGICRNASPLMLPYFKAHLAQPGTRQEGMGSLLWNCSQRANDLSEMHCWCSSTASANFSQYFRKSLLTQTQSTPAERSWGSKCGSCLHMQIMIRPGLSFGTASFHDFQVCFVNLHNSSPSLVFMPFKYK